MSDVTRKTEEWRAFSVHLLTASGAFLAFLAIVAAAEERFVAMWLWLGLAMIVDGIDGPLARKFDVMGVLPNWSGDTLDVVIDYATYVLIPAFALYQSGLVGSGLSFVAAALIVITSAIYYADTRMKTKDYFFRGFPVTWNMVIFALFAIRPGEAATFAVILFCAVTTFLPIKFLHPVRVKRMRALNLAITTFWGILALAAVVVAFEPNRLVTAGLVVTSLYLLLIGAALQAWDRLSGRATTAEGDAS